MALQGGNLLAFAGEGGVGRLRSGGAYRSRQGVRIRFAVLELDQEIGQAADEAGGGGNLPEVVARLDMFPDELAQNEEPECRCDHLQSVQRGRGQLAGKAGHRSEARGMTGKKLAPAGTPIFRR